MNQQERGIIIRSANKDEFIQNPPLEGELVYAKDTDELGCLYDGDVYWQTWDDTMAGLNVILSGFNGPEDSEGEDGWMYIQKNITPNGLVIIDYKKENGVWRALSYGETPEWCLDNLEPKNRHENCPWLGKYDYKMNDDFSTFYDQDVVNLSYFSSYVSTNGLIKTDWTTYFPEDYEPTDNDDIITANHLTSEKAIIIPPVTDPGIEGAIWNNNGVLMISQGG